MVWHPHSPWGILCAPGIVVGPKGCRRSGTGTNTHPLQCVSAGWLGLRGDSQGSRIPLPCAVWGVCDGESGCRQPCSVGFGGSAPWLVVEKRACVQPGVHLGSPAMILKWVQSFLMSPMGEVLEEGKKAFWKCVCDQAACPGAGEVSWDLGGTKHHQHQALV